MTELENAIQLLHSPHKENFDLAITMLDYVDGLKDYLHGFDAFLNILGWQVSPNSYFKLFKRERLLLHNNQLTELPDSIGDLSNLEILYLDNNQLTTLPNCIGNLTNLQYLQLDHNVKNVPVHIPYVQVRY